MKIYSYSTVLIAFFFLFLANAQTEFNQMAPVNPVALQYKVFDFGLRGSVKQADKMVFDVHGRITQNEEDGSQSPSVKGKIIQFFIRYNFNHCFNCKKAGNC